MRGITEILNHMKQYEQDNILSLFPQPVYNTTVVASNDEIQLLKQQSLYDVSNGSISNNNQVLQLTPLLEESILKKALDYMKILDFDIKLKIQTSWINHHKQGQWCQEHMHTNSMLSGVYFLDTPPNSGEFIFRRPGTDGTRLFSTTIRENPVKSNHYNSDLYTIIPRTSQLLIFPSYLTHSVSSNKIDQDRWTIAFNLFPSHTLSPSSINELKL